MILPGILSSQISGHLSTNSFESIATVTVGSGGAAYVEFTSIPSTYTHLQIRASARQSTSNVLNDTLLQFNGDTGSNYFRNHSLYGDGASSGAGAGSQTTSIYVAYMVDNGSTANVFGAVIIDILDYTSTNKNKTVRTLQGHDANGSGWINLRSGLWFPSTPAAITSLRITAASANFNQYSSFALYGVK